MASLLKKLARFRKRDIPDSLNDYQVKKAEYDESYRVVKGVLKIAGFRLTLVDSPCVTKCWNVYYWFVFSNMAVVTVLEAAYLARSISNGVYSDMFKMMPVIGFMFLAMTKSYNITYNRPVFENVINELRSLWPEGAVSKEEYDIVQRGYKNLRPALANYYTTVTLCLIFSYPPILIIIKSALGLTASEMYLPYLYWLPFDPFQSLGVYTAMIVAETWHCISTVWAMMSADLLFCTFLNHITTLLELLAVRIHRMVPVYMDQQLIKSYPLGAISKPILDVDRGLDEKIIEDNRLKEIREIAVRHQSLIRLAKDIENMFSFALLVNFLNSSVIICFCGLCTVFLEKWYEVDYKSFLVTTMLQNWIICWYGQRLIDSSLNISKALYNSGWYRASIKMRSFILIIMHRAQKEIHVTNYGFSVISLSTFTSIVKSSWSYFTLLINVMSK